MKTSVSSRYRLVIWYRRRRGRYAANRFFMEKKKQPDHWKLHLEFHPHNSDGDKIVPVVHSAFPQQCFKGNDKGALPKRINEICHQYDRVLDKRRRKKIYTRAYLNNMLNGQGVKVT